MPADHLERLRAARLFRQRSAQDLDALVRGTIGLHSTDYATPYLSAFARLDRFDTANLSARAAFSARHAAFGIAARRCAAQR